ncbi:MAG: dihydrofolate reductase family protein [Acidimicrobiales bacterium]
MSRVVAALSMSIDGFVAHDDDSVGHLFDWYENGDVEVRWPGMGMVSHVSAPSAAYLRRVIDEVGAIVVGRRVYDYTSGWGGDHPLHVPLYLVTHHAPESWPRDDAPFTAVTEGVAAAIGAARVRASEKAVVLAGPNIIQQAINLDLVDELSVDLIPLLLGSGVPFFGELTREDVILDDPEVIEGDRVTHLRYRLRRST